MKNGKAPGPDELPIEMIKLLKEHSLDALAELFNAIYRSGTIPKDWFGIPKKKRYTVRVPQWSWHEHYLSINVLTQRCLDVNKDVYACFVDYEKAFDRVRHEQLIKILREKQLVTQMPELL
ncbi:uncharacterized protein LOC115891356 [Sitophilus oryzae]|uniref:Uncharacterized protein LOC115891356 n=1 Tax=Sitophilus oryzae TaxID=7048 RepID=A0A6J2YU75_SITOR|nr:uncharacterized protein LOC115891356 [Sitophilus oryzae]